MEPFGSATKAIFLYGPEVHKLHLEFEVSEEISTITFSADLVAQDSITGHINGVAITAVTYAGSHAATMTALAEELLKTPQIISATVSGRVITLLFDSAAAQPVITLAITHDDAGTATLTYAKVFQVGIPKGCPVVFTPTGKIRYAISTDKAIDTIGVAVFNGAPGKLITIAAKGYTVIRAIAEANLTAGPVTVVEVQSDGIMSYSNTTDATAFQGWVWAPATAGDDIYVII